MPEIGALLHATERLTRPGGRVLAIPRPADRGAVTVLRQTAFPAPDVPGVTGAEMGVSQAGLLAGMVLLPALLAVMPPGRGACPVRGAHARLGRDGLRRFVPGSDQTTG